MGSDETGVAVGSGKSVEPDPAGVIAADLAGGFAAKQRWPSGPTDDADWVAFAVGRSKTP